jgi:hypothetical protein
MRPRSCATNRWSRTSRWGAARWARCR